MQTIFHAAHVETDDWPAYNSPMDQFVVAAFYKFTALPGYAALQAPLKSVCAAASVSGTILLAPEGVNGTIAGSRTGIDAALAALKSLPGCADLEHKESAAAENPFYRLKVRLKKEIVAFGVDGIDPAGAAGAYIDPAGWNEVIADPETVVIDARNDYEVGIGTFEGAINPRTKSFRDFPAWFREFRKTPAFSKHNHKPKIAMFCTGGIRCEKSTAFLKSEGIEDVVHLKGGILKYLETVPEAESKWRGECFVFDQRVSVRHGLEEGAYDQCFACRRPIDAAVKESPLYVEGVSCPACYDENDDGQRQRFSERQRQIALAKERGEKHMGRVLARESEDQ